MNIIFMGTPDFAVPCLKKLIDEGENVVAVFSQPDKKVGRKQLLTPPPVKQLSVEYDIPVYQPESLKNNDTVRLIRSFNADLIVVVAYGKILPVEVLEASEHGCINVHASLLPKYRGAAPIQWAVLNGDEQTGVTIMQMDEGLDTGDMLLVEKTEIDINETSEELFERLSVIGADALIKVINQFKDNTVTATPQPEADLSYAVKITREHSAIDWSRSAFDIHNQVRGLQSWPCASSVINGKNVKIHKTRLSDIISNEKGRIINNKNILTVCCGDGKCLDILEIQAEGKKKMDIKSYLAGNKIEVGTQMGV